MSLYYLDTSAAIKLVKQETDSAALAAFYWANAGAACVSSDLLRIELMRGVARALPVALPQARNVLLAFDYVAIDDDVVNGAIDEPDRMLRSLEAIHLATARLLGAELNALVTYDDRLGRAATDSGMRVVAPSD